MSLKDSLASSKVVNVLLSKKVLIGCSVGLSSAAALFGISRLITREEKEDEKLFLSNRLNTYEIYSSTKPNPKLTDLEHVEAFLEQSRPQFKDQIEQSLASFRRNYTTQTAQLPIGSGLYTGSLGASYMYFHLSSLWGTDSERKEFLNTSVKYLESYSKALSLEPPSSKMCSSLYTGYTSFHAVAAVIYNKHGQSQKSKEHLNSFLEFANKPHKYDTLLHGSAGFLQACSFINKHIPSSVSDDIIKITITNILEQGQKYAKSKNFKCPLLWPSANMHPTWFSSFVDQNIPQTGMSLGTLGILFSLLQFPHLLSENDKSNIKETIQFLQSLRLENGNFPLNVDGSDEKDLVQFARGPSGFVLLLIKAYEVFGDSKYLEEAKVYAKTVWQRGLQISGNSLNSGISGNGYVFLALFRVTKDPKFLFNAIQFGKFTWSSQAKTEQKISAFPFSLFEGMAGTVCFYVDLYSNWIDAKFPCVEL